MPDAMRLKGIGDLVKRGRLWRLTYTTCGHHQEFAALGLGELDQAATEVAKHFTHCLTCRLLNTQRQRRPTKRPRADRLTALVDEG